MNNKEITGTVYIVGGLVLEICSTLITGNKIEMLLCILISAIGSLVLYI